MQCKGHVRFAPNSDRESGFPQTVMFALPPKADVCGANRHVCYGPEADIRGAICHVRFPPTATAKQTYARQMIMSALPRKADIAVPV